MQRQIKLKQLVGFQRLKAGTVKQVSTLHSKQQIQTNIYPPAIAPFLFLFLQFTPRWEFVVGGFFVNFVACFVSSSSRPLPPSRPPAAPFF